MTNNQQTINEIVSVHLGKAGDGSIVNPYVTPEQVDKKLLVPVPRHLNRIQYNLTGDEFLGFDTWHAYEISFLTSMGYPVNCIAKIAYDCNSGTIVESKSLKLYLNSFNMSSMGIDVENSISNARTIIENDLSEALNTNVDVFLHRADSFDRNYVAPVNQSHFQCLDEIVDVDKIKFVEYAETPDTLEIDEHLTRSSVQVWTPSLRSNCRVTNQPDWGDVYIYVKGDKLPTHESLLRYIVSMRKENHFHEEICEAIYKRLYDKFQPDEILVTCLYTRRGGIDINPCRYSHENLIDMVRGLRDVKTITEKTLRQ